MGEVQPFSQASFLGKSVLGSPTPRLLATDMDGTLTRQGKFTAALVQGLEQLQRAGLPVVIVTGRSAGWVNGLAHYLPVAGAMAENGGVYFPPGRSPELLSNIADLSTHRQRLGEAFQQFQARWPQLQESDDNGFRLTDWTFDIADLTQSDLAAMAQLSQSLGWGFTYSTVQCHLFQPGQSKAAGLQQVLQRHFGAIAPNAVVTLGDSPNDESLFDPALFPTSVGVANIQDYWPQLTYRPAYVTAAAEVEGFLEVAAALLQAPPASS
jgi:HAD superfamily hydrolase (TIGR01484 family)